MTRIKPTWEYIHDRTSPRCPHCKAEMDDEPMCLGDVLEHVPFSPIPIRTDGYAEQDHRGQLVACKACDKLSVLTLTATKVYLIPARTHADWQLINSKGKHHAP